jgi:hypothetical protein
LFSQACGKYAEAVKIKPDHSHALINWGSTLSDWARTKRGADADELLAQACSKNAEAVKMKPDSHNAFNNWGSALLFWASLKQGADVKKILAQAREKLLVAESIREGAGAFNLACLESRLGNEGEAIRWLKVDHASGGQPNRKKITEDADFDSIRNSQAFHAFVETLPAE